MGKRDWTVRRALFGARPTGSALWRAASAVLLAFGLTAGTAKAGPPACKPKRPRPPIVLNNMGPCAFDAARLSFAGSPTEQASCLLRGMDATRNLVREPVVLPPGLALRIGTATELPEREALAAEIIAQGLDLDLVTGLWRGLSRAHDNDSNAPAARYFVIHDTSGPNYGRRPFPPDIDTRAKVNDLRLFKCSDGWEKAHAVVNRRGEVLLSHDFSIPWRESKFERALNFEGALKGLFLHVELIQPRRHAPGRGRRNDQGVPNPPFTLPQYERLALLYAVASVRAGAWIIPTFHAALDGGIRGGHDDPLGFDLAAFDRSLTRLVERVNGAPDRLGGRERGPFAGSAAD